MNTFSNLLYKKRNEKKKKKGSQPNVKKRQVSELGRLLVIGNLIILRWSRLITFFFYGLFLGPN
jgi:hypothetical protein